MLIISCSGDEAQLKEEPSRMVDDDDDPENRYEINNVSPHGSVQARCLVFENQFHTRIK